MPTSTTRATLRQELAKRLYRKRYPVVSTTTSDGTTATLIDEIFFPGSNRADYIGAWIYIASQPTSSAAVGEISRVFSTDFSSSLSTLILSPALSAAIKDTADYEIHYDLHPSILHERIEDVLDTLRHPVLLPLTLVTDGDMEDDPATNFTDPGLIIAPANDTTYVLHGKQSLKVTVLTAYDSANPYVSSATIYLPPKTEVICAADVYMYSALDVGKITLYDVTNSEDLETAEASNMGWAHLEFKYTTPATCNQIQLRLGSGSGSNDILYFDNAIVLPTKQASIPYPNSLEFASEIEKVFYFPLGTGLTGSSDDNAYAVLEKPRTFWGHSTVERDETAVVPYRLELEDTPITHPLWVEGRKDFAGFSGATEALKDADTTAAPKELVIGLAHALILDDFATEALEEGNENKYKLMTLQAERIRASLTNEIKDYTRELAVVRGAKH